MKFRDLSLCPVPVTVGQGQRENGGLDEPSAGAFSAPENKAAGPRWLHTKACLTKPHFIGK
jgi:hypothetical protein